MNRPNAIRLFALLACLVELAFRPLVWLLLAMPMAVSATDEFHQAYLPGRYASVEDWPAGAIGACIAYALLRHTPVWQWVVALAG